MEQAFQGQSLVTCLLSIQTIDCSLAEMGPHDSRTSRSACKVHGNRSSWASELWEVKAGQYYLWNQGAAFIGSMYIITFPNTVKVHLYGN